MATTEPPVSIAEERPLLTEWRTTTAPAFRAAFPVSSSEPSSTTRTKSTRGIARHARIVAAMVSAAFSAGIIAATRVESFTPLA